jgi:hypothetical protein
MAKGYGHIVRAHNAQERAGVEIAKRIETIIQKVASLRDNEYLDIDDAKALAEIKTQFEYILKRYTP